MADAARRTMSGIESIADERESGLVRLDELRQRLADGDRSEVAEDAVGELQAAYEELQVTEEELRAQSQELAHAYQRLVNERQRYRDLFEDAPVGYLTTDTDGMIRDANRAVASMVGRAQQYLRGKPLRVFVAEGERSTFSRWLRDLRGSHGTSAGQLRLAPQGVEPFDVRCAVMAVRGASGDIEALRWVIHPQDDEAAQRFGAGNRLRAVRAASPEDTTELSVQLVVLDAQPLFVRTLDVLLETMLPGRARIAAATDDPSELGSLVERTEPDLVVATVTEIDGAADAAVGSLRNDRPDLPLLVLAGAPNGTEDAILRVLAERGLRGVVPRGAAPDTVVGAILATATGWRVLDSATADVLMQPGRPLPDGLQGSLTAEEIDLWRGLAAGRPDAEMADERNVSVRTMKRRVSDLYERLGVSGRVEAAALAGYHGLVGPGELTNEVR